MTSTAYRGGNWSNGFAMRAFECPYLSGEVELSDERETHIAGNHPDLLPEYLAKIGLTLAASDQTGRLRVVNLPDFD